MGKRPLGLRTPVCSTPPSLHSVRLGRPDFWLRRGSRQCPQPPSKPDSLGRVKSSLGKPDNARDRCYSSGDVLGAPRPLAAIDRHPGRHLFLQDASHTTLHTRHRHIGPTSHTSTSLHPVPFNRASCFRPSRHLARAEVSHWLRYVPSQA